MVDSVLIIKMLPQHFSMNCKQLIFLINCGLRNTNQTQITSVYEPPIVNIPVFVVVVVVAVVVEVAVDLCLIRINAERYHRFSNHTAIKLVHVACLEAQVT